MMCVDAAQWMGIEPFAPQNLGAHALTFAGHKGPQGPQGIGGLWLDADASLDLPAPVWRPGEQAPRRARPSFCDLGTVPLASAAGLEAGLAWLAAQPHAIGAHTRPLIDRLIAGLAPIASVTIVGQPGGPSCAPIVSITCDHVSPEAIEGALRDRAILVRAGQHCAPLAHRTLGLEGDAAHQPRAGDHTRRDRGCARGDRRGVRAVIIASSFKTLTL